MPSVDVTSLITGLNPIRHTSSYTMPVLSPRHGSSSTLTGSYRSTYSSSSIDRPYSTYSSPRSYSYSERYTSRSYGVDDGKKTYAKHPSISEDGVAGRFRDESRESSTKRDSVPRDSGFRDGTSARSNSLRDSYQRDSSLTRIDASPRSSRGDLSTITVLESVADLRSKYSPANYVPSVLRRTDYPSRPRPAGGDIGKPPIERSEPRTIKLKKVTNENGVPNGLALTNTTNKLDNNEIGDDNGNRTSVAEIRKKFDPNYAGRKANGLFVEGVAIKTKQRTAENDNKPNTTNDASADRKKPTADGTGTVAGAKPFGRPAKCSKTTDLTVQETLRGTAAADGDAVDGKPFNHTTNFASYIPSKDAAAASHDNEKMNEGGDSDGEMESSDSAAVAVDDFYQRNVDVSSSFVF